MMDDGDGIYDSFRRLPLHFHVMFYSISPLLSQTTSVFYKGLQLVTWNVRSLYKPGAAQTVVDKTKRYTINIIAILEGS